MFTLTQTREVNLQGLVIRKTNNLTADTAFTKQTHNKQHGIDFLPA